MANPSLSKKIYIIPAGIMLVCIGVSISSIVSTKSTTPMLRAPKEQLKYDLKKGHWHMLPIDIIRLIKGDEGTN